MGKNRVKLCTAPTWQCELALIQVDNTCPVSLQLEVYNVYKASTREAVLGSGKLMIQ
ncbi:MAG: hypothetical protein ACRBFS_09525 [Aureispira sp.]